MSTPWKASGDGLDKPWCQRCLDVLLWRAREKLEVETAGHSKMCCLVLHIARPEQDVLPGITCCLAQARCVAWYSMLPDQTKTCCLVLRVARPCNKEKTFQRSLMEELEYCRTSWMQQEDLWGKSDQGTRTLQNLMQQAELPEESSGDILQSNIQRREDSLPQESGGKRVAGRQNVKSWQAKDSIQFSSKALIIPQWAFLLWSWRACKKIKK